MDYNLLIITSDVFLYDNLPLFFTEGFQVFHADSFLKALSFLAVTQFTAIVIDWSPSLEADTRMIYMLRWLSCADIIAFTHNGSPFQSYLCGGLIDHYIYLPQDQQKLKTVADAIQKTRSANHSRASHDFLHCRGLIVIPDFRKAYYGYAEIQLTRTEYNLLLYLFEHKNIALARERIMCGIWNNPYSVESDRTVCTHIKRLRGKIAQHTSEQYIETIWGYGYRFVDDLAAPKPENDDQLSLFDT